MNAKGADQDPQRGLLAVFTGNGKGKTTAALGMAVRMMGHGNRVCVLQFIKGNKRTGEARAAARFFGDRMEFQTLGRGFTFRSEDPEKDAAAARAAWAAAADAIRSGEYALVILDELTYVISYGMVPEADILKVLAGRPPGVHIAVTGRNATDGLLASADLITEMKAVRHPAEAGTAARKGIEF